LGLEVLILPQQATLAELKRQADKAASEEMELPKAAKGRAFLFSRGLHKRGLLAGAM